MDVEATEEGGPGAPRNCIFPLFFPFGMFLTMGVNRKPHSSSRTPHGFVDDRCLSHVYKKTAAAITIQVASSWIYIVDYIHTHSLSLFLSPSTRTKEDLGCTNLSLSTKALEGGQGGRQRSEAQSPPRGEDREMEER